MAQNLIIYIVTFCISLFSSRFLIKMFTKYNLLYSNKIISDFLKVNKKHVSMGGMAILLALNLSFCFLYFLSCKPNFSILLLGNAYGLIGLVDDILKFTQKKRGLLIKARLLYETLGAFFFVNYINSVDANRCYIPILHNFFNIQFLNIFWGTLIIVATANAYNLTDGVDSLASTLGIYTLTFIAIFVPEARVFSILLICSILGTLVYNWPPAKLIMGDVGALSIGAMIGAIFYKHHMDLFLPLVGIVFVLETLSSGIQIYYIRFLQKRLFLMAPLHHHFEKKGWDKPSILILFNTIGILSFCLACLIKIYYC